MRKKKAKRSARPIVAGHLEKISSTIFDQNRSLITEMIKGRYGVYALYRREKLYYVGLATNLRSRINQHLKDRHKGKWTHFSLYILRKTDHLREIETLLLRIADPTGNYMKGKLKSSKDLRPELKVLLTEDAKRLIEDILGGKKPAPKRVKKKKTTSKAKLVERPLKGKFPGGKVIYANYKGNKYKAWVRTNGGIKFKGQMYDTPTGAAMAVIDKGAVNGWNFWRYKDKSGSLVPLTNLHK
ncbi:MAG TPA: GIY-YIG nuclease family protein [Sedimentisphaerales bacterium]|nr:GIY-YIG nuclease family protein [Sedimentisphaerales bacterium]